MAERRLVPVRLGDGTPLNRVRTRVIMGALTAGATVVTVVPVLLGR